MKVGRSGCHDGVASGVSVKRVVKRARRECSKCNKHDACKSMRVHSFLFLFNTPPESVSRERFHLSVHFHMHMEPFE